MNHDLMKKALMAKKGKGVDVTISINPSDEMKPSGDLAPANPDAEESNESPEEMQMEQQMGEPQVDQAMKPGQDQNFAPDMHEALMGNMSDYDKEHLMQSEPKSLGGKARKASIMKHEKGKV